MNFQGRENIVLNLHVSEVECLICLHINLPVWPGRELRTKLINLIFKFEDIAPSCFIFLCPMLMRSQVASIMGVPFLLSVFCKMNL